MTEEGGPTSSARVDCAEMSALACAGANCWVVGWVPVGNVLAVKAAESRPGSNLVGPWESNCGWISTSGLVGMSGVVCARLASAVAAAISWVSLSCCSIN